MCIRDRSSGISRQLDRRLVLERERDGERRAFAERRSEFDGATEDVRETLRKCQTESRAAVATRGRPIDLPELLEHVLLRVGRDPDAGVLYAVDDAVVGQGHARHDLT